MAQAEVAHEELRDQLETPSGPLRVQLPAAYALDALMPALVAFGSRYPEIRLQLGVADLGPADRAPDIGDVSIRLGELPDSSLVARRLGTVQAGLYASPAYLASRGAPQTPADLERHDCIGLRIGAGQAAPWLLQYGNERRRVPAAQRYGVNDACMARQLAVLGAGIAALGGEADGLVRVLPDWSLGPAEVYAVTETRLLPAKTRYLIDFLAHRLDPLAHLPETDAAAGSA
ncbi:HTH-type transcriptional regulator DmlR [compost metagenome]